MLRKIIGVSWSELSPVTGLTEYQLKDSARVRGGRKRNPLGHNSSAKWKIVNQLGVRIDSLLDRDGAVLTITGADYSLLWFFAWRPANLRVLNATATEGRLFFSHLIATQILTALHRQEWFMHQHVYGDFEDADAVPWQSLIKKFSGGRRWLFHFRDQIRRRMFKDCPEMKIPTTTELYHAVHRYDLRELFRRLDADA